MKALVGQVPQLPWWKLQAMTDAEIQAFNSSHLQEIEMKDDSLADAMYGVRSDSVGKIEQPSYQDIRKRYEGKPDVIKAALGQQNVYANQVWNEAIEAAANKIENFNFDLAEKIRGLKK